MLALFVAFFAATRVGASSSSPPVSYDMAPLPIPELPVLTFAGPDWVNVKSPPFNAKGDGITDDTAAIQKALSIMAKVSA